MIFDLQLEERLDEILIVDDDPAFETTRRLAVEERLFVGMSSGAAVAGAIQLARCLSSGTIVALFPDRGDRYLSTSLFRSTPSLHMDGWQEFRILSGYSFLVACLP